jgi:hypothetical protein
MSRSSQQLIAAFGALVMIFVMRWTALPMGPGGIVDFEFAGTLEKADAIMMRWGAAGLEAALLNTRLDFIFILFYAAWGYLALQSLGAREPSLRLRSLARQLSYAMIAAGVLDVLENICMFQTMGSSREALFPLAAWWLAAVKFACIVASLLLMLVLWGRKLIKR